MQIRVRGNQVEYLRASYDSSKGRSVQKLIKPEDFTPEEQAQAEQYRKEKEAASMADQQAWSAQRPEHWLNQIAVGIDAGSRPNDEPALWKALKNLQKSLRKAGIRRPIPEPKPAKTAVKKAAKRPSRKKT